MTDTHEFASTDPAASDRRTKSDRGPPAEAQLLFAWTDRVTSDHSRPPPAAEPVSKSAEVAADDEYEEHSPGHPWHYYHEGDNATPVPATAITAGPCPASYFGRELPTSGAKRLMKAHQLLEAERQGLEAARKRYQEIVDRGADALSRYDKEIAHGGNVEMARASALALTYNHVCWHLGRVAFLERELSGSVARWR